MKDDIIKLIKRGEYAKIIGRLFSFKIKDRDPYYNKMKLIGTIIGMIEVPREDQIQFHVSIPSIASEGKLYTQELQIFYLEHGRQKGTWLVVEGNNASNDREAYEGTFELL
jgi:hypothetical protein